MSSFPSNSKMLFLVAILASLTFPLHSFSSADHHFDPIKHHSEELDDLEEWAKTFALSSARAPNRLSRSPSPLLRRLAREDIDEEPLVISRYNRHCFFTPINCFVGRAGMEAGNIVGSASNSRRHILFIRRRQK